MSEAGVRDCPACRVPPGGAQLAVTPAMSPRVRDGYRRPPRARAGGQAGSGHDRADLVTSVWTADCSATVEMARLAGPRHGPVLAPGRLLDADGIGVCWCDLDKLDDRVLLYERCLLTGSPFDIYRFVNALDLCWVLPLLRLPEGLRADWRRALAGLGHSVGPRVEDPAPGAH